MRATSFFRGTGSGAPYAGYAELVKELVDKAEIVNLSLLFSPAGLDASLYRLINTGACPGPPRSRFNPCIHFDTAQWSRGEIEAQRLGILARAMFQSDKAAADRAIIVIPAGNDGLRNSFVSSGLTYQYPELRGHYVTVISVHKNGR